MAMLKSARTDAKELYVRTAEWVRGLIEAIGPDQWRNATPCAEWDMRELVNHVVGENLWIEQFFTGKTMEEVGNALDGDILGDDPVGTFAASVERNIPLITQANLDGSYRFSFGTQTGLDYITGIFADMLVHGWDIAKGAKQPITMDEELILAATPLFEEVVPSAGQGTAFGYKQKLAGDPSLLAKLLAVVGRREDWRAPTGATWR